MGFIFLIILIVLVVLYINLQARVSGIEQVMRGKKLGSVRRERPQEAEHKARPKRAVASRASSTPQKVSRPEHTLDDRLVAWLKEDWLMKLGALLVLIAFGWFVTYAFSHGWIGPLGRVLLGVILGIAILAVGWWRMSVSKYQGSIFTALGGAVVLLSLFAGRGIYDLFTPTLALTAMAITAGFVTYVAVRFEVRWLSLAGLLLAGVAPLLVNSPEPDFIGLFSYLLVVVLGVLSVVYYSGSRGLTGFALIIVSFYSLFAMGSALSETLLYFAYAFTAIFFAASLFEILKQKKKDIIPDLLTAGGTGLFLLTWVLVAGSEASQSLVLLAWMVAFFLGSFFIYETSGRKEAFYTYGAIAGTFLAVVTALELNGAALVIALTAEAGLLTIASHVIAHDRKVTNAVSTVFAVPTFFIAFELVWYMFTTDGVFSGEFFSIFFFVLVTLGLGYFLRLKRHTRPSRDDKSIEHAFFALSIVSAYFLYWIFFAKLFESHAYVTIAVTVLNVATILGLYQVMKSTTVIRRSIILLGIPFLMTIPHFALYPDSVPGLVNAFDEHFMALFVYGVALLGMGVFLRRCLGKKENVNKIFSNTLFVASAFYGLGLLWMLFHQILSSGDIATMFSLASYTVFGITAYFVGLFEEKRVLRDCGAILLLFVVARLLLVDVWNMELALRIATFFFVGILLIGTAFLTRRQKIEK